MAVDGINLLSFDWGTNREAWHRSFNEFRDAPLVRTMIPCPYRKVPSIIIPLKVFSECMVLRELSLMELNDS
jgi:hypothetical protein